MISSEMEKLAKSIHANGEAIKVFREQYIPALRSIRSSSTTEASAAASSSSSSSPSAATTSSPAEHVQLIQGVMDNMEQIRTLASASAKRVALPLESDCELDFSVRNCAILGDLNELPQSRIVNAVRSQIEHVDSLVQSAEEAEKLLRNC